MKLCERGANPRQREEFQVECKQNLEIRVRGLFYVFTLYNFWQIVTYTYIRVSLFNFSWTLMPNEGGLGWVLISFLIANKSLSLQERSSRV